jgi:hypothetical protein
MGAPSFELICEVEPRTRPDLMHVRHQIGVLSRIASASSSPTTTSGRATVSSIAVAHEVQLMGGRGIACLIARDRNVLCFHRDLLTAAAYGVSEFLFVYGDRPETGARSDDLTVRSMLAEARGFSQGGNDRPFRLGVASGLQRLPAWKRDAGFLLDPGHILSRRSPGVARIRPIRWPRLRRCDGDCQRPYGPEAVVGDPAACRSRADHRSHRTRPYGCRRDRLRTCHCDSGLRRIRRSPPDFHFSIPGDRLAVGGPHLPTKASGWFTGAFGTCRFRTGAAGRALAASGRIITDPGRAAQRRSRYLRLWAVRAAPGPLT